MKWTRTLNLRFVPIVLKAICGLMLATVISLIVAVAWRGEPILLVLKGSLVPVYTSLSYLVGLALARGRTDIATEFALEAIPMPSLFLIFVMAGSFNGMSTLMQGVMFTLIAGILILFWTHALRELRKAMRTQAEED